MQLLDLPRFGLFCGYFFFRLFGVTYVDVLFFVYFWVWVGFTVQGLRLFMDDIFPLLLLIFGPC